MKFNSILTPILAAAVILLLFVSPRFCSPKQTSDIDSLSLANQQLDSLVNLQGKMVYEQEVLITASKERMRELTDSIFQLQRKYDKKIKDVIAYYKGSTVTTIDSVLIPYIDTIKMRKIEDSVWKKCGEVLMYLEDSFILVPRRVVKETPEFRFAGTILKEGLMIDSISIPDTLQLRFIEKKGKLFRQPTTYVQFFHSNPLITTTQSNSVLYKPPRKPRILEKVIAVGLGIFIGSKL